MSVQYLRHIKVTPCLARGGYDLSIFGPKVTQDFPGGAGDLKILVPRSWYQNLGTNILVPESWYQNLKVTSPPWKVLGDLSSKNAKVVAPPGQKRGDLNMTKIQYI